MNKMMTTQVMRGLSVLAVAAALAACGGGGGGEDFGGGGGGGVVTPPAPADLQAEKASGYVANSANAYMFNQLNAARMKCGFGALHHDTRLDVSAQNHADWIARNNYESTHNEVSGTPGFTGVNSRQRMEYVNYKAFAEAEFPGSNVSNFLASEGISSANNFEDANYYKAHIPLQLSIVYHANGALRGYRNIGFGAAKRSTYGFAAGEIILHNLGSETASQKLAGDMVSTYPCDGVTALRTFHGNERPNPLGTRDLVKNPPGHPVSILSRWGTKLTEIKVVMNEVSTGAEVKMAAVRTMDNDTSGLMLRNEAFAIPDAELKKSTSYSVKITGKVDGKDFENNFTFTTGTVDSIAHAGGRYE